MGDYWIKIFRIARSNINHQEKIKQIQIIANQYPCKTCKTHFHQRLLHTKPQTKKELLTFIKHYRSINSTRSTFFEK